jgi:uncharacterized Zn finger protein
MTIPGLSEEFIRQNATPASIHRGQEYHRHETVLSLVQGDDTLESQVRGSGQEPYRVRITFNRKGITRAECTCPYNYGGWCKHIVATLLTCLDDSDGFAGAFFGDLGRVWSQVLPMADLTPAERRKWRRKLKRWQNEIGPYGIVDVFSEQ